MEYIPSYIRRHGEDKVSGLIYADARVDGLIADLNLERSRHQYTRDHPFRNLWYWFLGKLR